MRGAGNPTAGRWSAHRKRRGGPAETPTGSWDRMPMPDHVMNYIECDVPANLTLAEWRRSRIETPRRRRLRLRTFIPARQREAFAI